jgi:hypothetical protein
VGAGTRVALSAALGTVDVTGFATRLIAPVALLIAAVPAATGAQEPDGPPALFAEPPAMATALDFAGRYGADDSGDPPRDGFYPVFGGMITGAGWISIGPGYRTRLFADRAVFDTSAAISWRGYKKAQARFELSRLADGRMAVGSQVLWQDLTQIEYFGRGARSIQAARADYRLRTADIIGYAAYRPAPGLTVAGRIGRLARPSLSSSRGPFDRDLPDAQTVFVHDAAFALPEQPGYVHGELSATLDTRDHAGHPRRGGMYRAAWSAYSDRDLGAFSFDRLEIEAVQAVPLHHHLWTLVVHGWTALSSTAAGQQIPAYMLPAIGGANTLRSFSDYRFHDRNLLLLSAESRWALFPRVDGALFVDGGGVAARARNLSLDHASYGAGVRVHTGGSTLARLDVAGGREGWRVVFRLNDPFKPARLSRQTAAIPFVP